MVTGTIGRRSIATALTIGACLFALSEGSAEPDAPCWASVEFDPPRATLGQQVILRVRITRYEEVESADWIEPTAYVGARVEQLPDWNGEASLAGSTVRVREERRALFPHQPGRLHIEASHLRCTRNVDGARRIGEFAVPGATLEVVDAPHAGRPEDFTGTIGPVALQAIAVPQKVSLGETVRLALMVRGQSDLWNLPDPLPEISTAEIFRRRPELTIETGPVLSVVRHFAYDVVPQKEGELIIPEIHLRVFDPTNQRFERVTTAPIRIMVAPRRTRASQTDTRPEDPEIERLRIDSTVVNVAATRLRWASVAAAPVCAGVGYWAWRNFRRKRRRIEILVAALEKELGARANPAAVATILRAALRSHVPHVGSMSAEEIAGLPNISIGVRDAAYMLAAVERARFDPNTPIPDRAGIIRALKDL